MQQHIIPVKVYVRVYIILLALLAVTWGVAQVHLGPYNNLAAMTVAVIKAVLVILFFMGVKYSSKLIWVWAGAGFLWLIILFGIFSDYLTRSWVHIQGW